MLKISVKSGSPTMSVVKRFPTPKQAPDLQIDRNDMVTREESTKWTEGLESWKASHEKETTSLIRALDAEIKSLRETLGVIGAMMDKSKKITLAHGGRLC